MVNWTEKPIFFKSMLVLIPGSVLYLLISLYVLFIKSPNTMSKTIILFLTYASFILFSMFFITVYILISMLEMAPEIEKYYIYAFEYLIFSFLEIIFVNLHFPLFDKSGDFIFNTGSFVVYGNILLLLSVGLVIYFLLTKKIFNVKENVLQYYDEKSISGDSIVKNTIRYEFDHEKNNEVIKEVNNTYRQFKISLFVIILFFIIYLFIIYLLNIKFDFSIFEAFLGTFFLFLMIKLIIKKYFIDKIESEMANFKDYYQELHILPDGISLPSIMQTYLSDFKPEFILNRKNIFLNFSEIKYIKIKKTNILIKTKYKFSVYNIKKRYCISNVRFNTIISEEELFNIFYAIKRQFNI